MKPFAETISRMDATAYWAALREIGWGEGLPERELDALEQAVIVAFAENPQLAWMSLAACSPDSELIYALDGPLSYVGVLDALAEGSRGQFEPHEVVSEISTGQLTVRFQQAGKQYTFVTQPESDYVDARLLEVVNRALAESQVRQRFWQLPAVDQLWQCAFETEPIWRAANEQGLLPQPRLRVPWHK